MVVRAAADAVKEILDSQGAGRRRNGASGGVPEGVPPAVPEGVPPEHGLPLEAGEEEEAREPHKHELPA